MRSRLICLGVSAATLAFGTGCRAMLLPALIVSRVAFTAAVVAASQPRVVVVEAPLAPFDAAAAHASLSAVDPSACWAASGGVHGYGRARVTFATDGTVQLVEITNPVRGAVPDSACISSSYGAIHVPPFGGSSVAVYTTFFVR